MSKLQDHRDVAADGAPRISVIIPCYNAADCLPRAVASVQHQSVQDWEILVIDDASTDQTLAVADSLAQADGRLRILRQEVNQGPSAARNRGLEAAGGQWIAVLDADDAMNPGRLERLLETAARHGADVVADNLTPYDHGADCLMPAAFAWRQEHRLSFDLLLARDVYMQGAPLGWIKPMWKREFLMARGLRYPVQYRHAEDFYLLASVLLEGASFWLRPDADYIYTLRQGPISKSRSPFSASQPNLANVAASCEDLMQRYAARLSASQKRQLAARVRRFMWGGSLVEIRSLLGARRPLAAGVRALTHPGALALYAQVKLAGLSRRLGLAQA